MSGPDGQDHNTAGQSSSTTVQHLLTSLADIHADQNRVQQWLSQLVDAVTTQQHAKEDFRRAEGFELVLRILRKATQSSTATEPVSIFEIVCRLLGAALQQHRGNSRYFTKRCNGWHTLGEVVDDLLSAATVSNEPAPSTSYVTRIGQALLSLSLGTTSSSIDKQDAIQHASAAGILVVQICKAETEAVVNGLVSTLEELTTLCENNIHNQVLLWSTGSTSALLRCSTRTPQNGKVEHLAKVLLQRLSFLGLADLNDVAHLFKSASVSDDSRDLALDILRRSKAPSFVQFDLTQHGFSSVELPSLPKAFPPTSGYTFSAWLRFDAFDPDCHTTIFGLFDPQQTCFVLAYLEKDTHQLILQTSIKSARPSVRFKSSTFEPARWYHMALVHRKSNADPKQSSASLFVDGEFVEQIKCAYPESPSLVKDSKSASTVQLFLGTPRDLAFKVGPHQTTSKWSIGLMHLFEASLSDEFIAVQYRLGPRYSGNFQDCLGPLLTYRGSAELNRYNELLHPDKSEKSDIIRATEEHGSDVVPESKILMSFSPHAIILLDHETESSLAIADLGFKSADKYKKLVSKAVAIAINAAVPSLNEAILRPYGVAVLTGDPVVAAPVALDDATWCLAGTLAPLYYLVESADTSKSLLTSVEIFTECVKDNWRISESMEKSNGYGVFAMLLREKLGLDAAMVPGLAVARKPKQPLALEHRDDFMRRCLPLILDFVGHDSKAPEKSMIINPMAYRVLLMDFDTWRRGDLETAKLFFSQFDHFSHRNLHQAFNQKRFGRMRVVRKLVDAMKIEDFDPALIEPLMLALRRLSDGNSSQNALKDLAMFVAYGLHDERMSTKSSTPSLASMVRLRQHAASWAARGRSSGTSTPGSTTEASPTPSFTRSQLAVRTLQLLAELVCEQNSGATTRRFIKAVPTRWLSHMLSEGDLQVVCLDLRIICQAFAVLGQEFKHPFVEKNGGYVAMKARLKGLWQSSEVWLICWSILLGRKAPPINMKTSFSVYSLIHELQIDDVARIVNQEMMNIILAMLEAGLRAVAETDQPATSDVNVVETAIQLLNELYMRSQAFRDFAVSSTYVQDLLFVLYPVVVGSDRLSADTEVRAEKDTLSFKGEEVVMRPHSNSLGERPPSVRSLNLSRDSRTPSPKPRRIAMAPRRLSSFVLVNAGSGRSSLPAARFSPAIASKPKEPVKLNVGNTIIESLLEIPINLFIEQICNKKDFNGIGLFQKVPPGFREHQAYFESYVLVHTITQLWSHLQLQRTLLQETKVLTNLSRFCQHIAEAVFEGWFIDGAQTVIDFTGKVLEYLQQPDIAEVKAVRLCSQAVNSMRVVFLRVTLLRLSELDESTDEEEAVAFLQQMCYWQTILFSSENQETLFTKLICFLLYLKLTSPLTRVRLAAATLWRLVLMQKPTETATMLTVSMGAGQRHLSTGFMRLVQMNDDDFITWVDDNRNELDAVLIEALAKPWATFVADENRRNEETARSRLIKRKEKLRQWQQEESSADEFLHRFELSTNHWRSNIHSQERLKLQRAIQDHHEAVNGMTIVMSKLERQLHQPAGLLQDRTDHQWRLDLTEGPNRMRMRLLRDKGTNKQVFQSKRKASELKTARRLTLNTRIPAIKQVLATPSPLPPDLDGGVDTNEMNGQALNDSISGSQLLEGGFEMIEDPKEDEDGIIEDKNRKIMTSLQRGDVVQQLYNVSRIIGLEACEGLLVLGKKCLYMQDGFFQRSDGEIVSVTQAPEDERDPYLQLISGKDVGTQPTKNSIGEQATRHWTWAQVLIISKRRFLLRDVSIEIFFADGRSYLLTCLNTKVRDDLYTAIVSFAPHVHSKVATGEEDSWRLDNLRNPGEAPSSIGSKFANVFSGASGYAATKAWCRGEMSNFRYLMLINTLAGRSFNDLTQYPVFPWVLADYHSEELDLTDPRSFRDFSKPMGCQTLAREAEFRDRFKQFAEMSDQSAPAFNYGTHYSSAMIVSSYLIRLQPFVQTYLLLQGGSFDHADRLFDSIEKAWLSASRDNMSDVRELTPEFFYLPEFLLNINKYDFGLKQGDGGTVNDVQLPPWAKGDPQVFIAKHREALESPYVSAHLQQWIDLVFGYKQRGEAAVAAANVFQHLSYDGAKDLDTIDDPVERLATIGIIHSFGQTPHQVFPRPHPEREIDRDGQDQVDAQVESLVRLPMPLFESQERVARLTYSSTQERLLCCGPGRANLMPACDRYLQWKTSDSSLRFYSSNSKRLVGLYENTHIGTITDTCFADSKTLITAGADCTLSVWTVVTHRNWIELQSQICLFGHRSPVSLVTASRIFSTILSASKDGQVLLWDLNRYDCIRELRPSGSKRVQAAAVDNVTGQIMLCCGPDVLLYTLNGQLLLQQKVVDNDSDRIACCAIYEGARKEWTKRQIIFTGHDHGIANAWSPTVLDDGTWHLQLVHRLNHTDSNREDGGNISATITAILPLANAVYTGDDRGQVWQWDCIRRQGVANGRVR